MKTAEPQILSDLNSMILKNAFKTKPGLILNATAVSKQLNIPVGNSNFRKFINDEDEKHLGSKNLNKLLDYFDYEFIMVPVLKGHDTEDLNKIAKTNILNLAKRIETFKLLYQKKEAQKVLKKRADSCSDILLEDLNLDDEYSGLELIEDHQIDDNIKIDISKESVDTDFDKLLNLLDD